MGRHGDVASDVNDSEVTTSKEEYAGAPADVTKRLIPDADDGSDVEGPASQDLEKQQQHQTQEQRNDGGKSHQVPIPNPNPEGGSSPSSSVFYRGEREVQDALFSRAFLLAMVLLLLRELFIFFWPILGLHFFDFSTLSIGPATFFTIFLGLLLGIPGCFLFLWAMRNATPTLLRACLVVATAVFLLSSLNAVLTWATEQPLGSVEEGGNFSGYDEQPGGVYTSPASSSSSSPFGSSSPQGSLIEAALPGSVARLLLSTSGTAAVALSIHRRRLHTSPSSLTSSLPSLSTHGLSTQTSLGTFALLPAPSSSSSSSLLRPALTHPSSPGALITRFLLSMPTPSLGFPLQRRRLQVGSPTEDPTMTSSSSYVQRQRLMSAEQFLTGIINAAGTVFILWLLGRHLNVAATAVSQSANCILTRGRGLVFAGIGLIAAMALLTLPLVSFGWQVASSCNASSGMGLAGGMQTAAAGAPGGDGGALCASWVSALFVSPFSSIMVMLGLALALWLWMQVSVFVQFVASHVVGQCYGGDNTVALDEGEMQLVVRAVRCACKESFGTISFVSLVRVAVVAVSFLINVGLMMLLQDSVFVALPLVVNSCCVFAAELFLMRFVLPIAALRGFGFADAALAAVDLLALHFRSAAAVTISSLCAVGVLVFLAVVAITIFGFTVGIIFGSMSNVEMAFVVIVFVLMVLFVVATVACMAVFNCVFSASVATTYVCLVSDGKVERDDDAPAAVDESSALVANV